MYTDQLVELLKKYKFSKNKFCGVLSLDQVPLKRVKHPCAFVVNTHDSTQPGEHWFAIYLPVRGPAEYFDSYGLPPFQQRIVEFLKKNSNSFIHNKQRIQSDTSVNCGLFSLFYLYFRTKGYTMKQYLKFFVKDNLSYNDHIVNYLYKKYKLK